MKRVFGIGVVVLLVLWSTAFVFRGQNQVIGKSRSVDVDVVDGNDTDAMVRAMHRGRPYISVYTFDVKKGLGSLGSLGTLTFEKCQGPLPVLVCTVTASNYSQLEGIYFRADAYRD